MSVDEKYQEQGRELNDGVSFLFCLQTYLVFMGADGQWCYHWSWDFGDLFATFELAETERWEFRFDGCRTRIVKMRASEFEVMAVHESMDFPPAGRLF